MITRAPVSSDPRCRVAPGHGGLAGLDLELPPFLIVVPVRAADPGVGLRVFFRRGGVVACREIVVGEDGVVFAPLRAIGDDPVLVVDVVEGEGHDFAVDIRLAVLVEAVRADFQPHFEGAGLVGFDRGQGWNLDLLADRGDEPGAALVGPGEDARCRRSARTHHPAQLGDLAVLVRDLDRAGRHIKEVRRVAGRLEGRLLRPGQDVAREADIAGAVRRLEPLAREQQFRRAKGVIVVDIFGDDQVDPEVGALVVGNARTALGGRLPAGTAPARYRPGWQLPVAPSVTRSGSSFATTKPRVRSKNPASSPGCAVLAVIRQATSTPGHLVHPRGDHLGMPGWDMRSPAPRPGRGDPRPPIQATTMAHATSHELAASVPIPIVHTTGSHHR